MPDRTYPRKDSWELLWQQLDGGIVKEKKLNALRLSPVLAFLQENALDKNNEFSDRQSPKTFTVFTRLWNCIRSIITIYRRCLNINPYARKYMNSVLPGGFSLPPDIVDDYVDVRVNIVDSNRKLTSENADLKERVTLLTSENSRLQSEVDRLKAINANLQATVASLTKENASLQADKKATDEKIAKLLAEKQITDQKIAKLEAEKVISDSQIQQLQAEKIETDAKLKKMQGDIELLFKQLSISQKTSPRTPEKLSPKKETLSPQLRGVLRSIPFVNWIPEVIG